MSHWSKGGTDYAVFHEIYKVAKKLKTDPRTAIKALLGNYDMGANAKNLKTDAKSIKLRREWVQAQAKELLAAVKKKEGESDDDFAMRKLLLELQFEEAERFYAEAEELEVGWKMNLAKMTGRVDLNLSAIKDTSLAKSIELLGVKPSHFAGIPRSENAILSLRVNHPLDDMRKKNGLRFFTAMYNRQLAKIKADTRRSADEKKAAKQAADLVFGILRANLEAGIFDIFAEVHPNAGKQTALSGFATVDGTKMVDVLKLFPKTHKGAAVKLDIAKQGTVRIHKVTIKPTKDAIFDTFVGGDSVYIGTSKGAVWFAAGPKALLELTTAIKSKDDPPKFKAEDPFVDVYVKVGSWLDFLDKLQGGKADPALSKLAHDAFKPGKDALTLQLRRKKDRIVGNMDIQTDVLRFVGAMIADFSEKNLAKKKK